MKIKEIYSYRNKNYKWILPIKDSLKKISKNIFFEKDGSPLKREVIQIDRQLLKLLTKRFGSEVKSNYCPMISENKFNVDILLPTKPATLIEIEKGKLPRLELDLMKITNSIYKFPSKYGYGCIIVPVNYIELKLAGLRSPYQYLVNHLISLNSTILDVKDKDRYLLKDLVVIGYHDPRGE